MDAPFADLTGRLFYARLVDPVTVEVVRGAMVGRFHAAALFETHLLEVDLSDPDDDDVEDVLFLVTAPVGAVLFGEEVQSDDVA